MKIISGRFKGRRIETLQSKSLRPTMGIAREAVFNILGHGHYAENGLLDGGIVLDLFCGSGALGLEALSRGMEKAVFIDKEEAHLKCVRQNLEKIGELNNARVLRADSTQPPRAQEPCDLVFLDPPYQTDFAAKTLHSIARNGWLKRGSVIVMETGKLEDVAYDKQAFTLRDERRYGNSKIQILIYDEQETI